MKFQTPVAQEDAAKTQLFLQHRDSTITLNTDYTKATENSFDRPGSVFPESDIDFHPPSQLSRPTTKKQRIELESLEKLDIPLGLEDQKAILRREIFGLRALMMFLVMGIGALAVLFFLA